MAEPARKYDADIEPDIRPRFGVIQGGGESSPERGDLHEADNSAAEDLQNQERNFGVINGGSESSPNRGNLRAVSDEDNSSKNIDNLRDKETDGPWKNNVTGGSQKQPVLLKDVLKKKGPLGALAVLVLGGGAGLSLLLTPGLMLVHVKEALVNDLDDGTPALTQRTNMLMRARMVGALKDSVVNGFCTSKISVRCRFSTASKNQIENMTEKGNIKVECEGGSCDKKFRNRITKLTFKDGTSLDNPSNFSSFMRSNPTAFNDLNRSFSPKFFAYTSSRAKIAFSKILGISKRDTLENKSVNEAEDAATHAAQDQLDADGNPITPTEKDGKTVYVDQDGNPILGADGNPITAADAQQGNEILTELKDEAGGGGGAASRYLGGAVKGAAILGAMDTACSIKNAITAVNMGAKVIRAQQLSKVAEVTLTEADKIKADQATQEATTALGNLWTAPNTQKQIVDPADPNKMTANPDYGKSALDSAGMSIALHGDIPMLDTASSMFQLGGVSGGVLSKALGIADTLMQGVPSAKGCHIVQNFWVRGASLAVGIIAAFVPPGAGTVKFVAGAAAGVAAGFVMNYLSGMLTDMIAGDISGAVQNVGLGDATFAGAGNIMQTTAGTYGLMPLTSQNIGQYMSFSKGVDNEYVAAATQEAKKTPFDVMNQYSFLGSFARSLLPAVDNNTSALNTVASIVTSPLTLLGSKVNASGVDLSRFDQCNDEDYAKLGIKADIFCNLRRGLSDKELAMDPVTVANYMVTNHYIDDNKDGDVDNVAIAGSDYQKFLVDCAERTVPFGPQGKDGGDDDWSTGKKCLENSDMLSNFKVFTTDYTLLNGMDGTDTGFDSSDNSSAPTDSTGNPVTGSDFEGDTYKQQCSTYLHAGVYCPGQAYAYQCTAFVNFWLAKHKIIGPTQVVSGNGGQIVGTLGSFGFTTNKTPAVHSVFSTSHTSHPSLGHTGIVSQVNSDGSIVVEEYNFTHTEAYDTRTISASDVRSYYTFAHTETKYQ